MNSSNERNPVELLAEEFLDRKRRGEHPTLREYVERYPELADEIRDLFPALLMMEDQGESASNTTGSLAADNGVALGTRLERLGDYRILREIGRGGMGVVYEAEQESLGRRVALKVLSAGSLLDPKQVRRFEREAKAAARLHHTNIVPVFGVGRQDGHHYFVMQFIAGLGLDVVLDDLRRLRTGNSGASPGAGPAPAANRVAGLTGVDVARSLITGRFDANAPPMEGSVTESFEGAAADPPAFANGPPAAAEPSGALLPGSPEPSASSDPDRQFYRSVARIGIQVAEALEYANRQGILHRDVKPSNLLLDNHGNVWVADFGLAKTAEAEDLTHTGDILGTIRYMAPERFLGHCDARSDVYSLGLTLYELVALRPAYEATDRHALMERVLHEEPERLKKLAPNVPRDLETIVAKAIARDPVARYATAGALAEDLRRYVEDRPIRARRVSPAERLMRWCRRNKRLAASIGVAAAALVDVAVLSLLYADRHARHAAEQAEASERIRLQASELERRSNALASSLSESNRRLATLNFERGQAAFEKGQVGVGMLWTVESLRMATEAGDEAGRHVALANLTAWRRQLAELKKVFYHGKVVLSVALSPDCKTIVTGSFDKTARLWDAATGRPLGQPLAHSGLVYSVAFSPAGKRILTGSFDKTARLWDADSGHPLGHPLEHSASVMSVAYSPDGKTILTGSRDKTARLWDATSGRPLGQPLEHSGTVWSVAFSPDGRSLLTSDLRTARLWEAPAPLPDDVPRLAAWVEAATGLEMDKQGAVRALDRAAWLERRQRLDQLGGPPPADPAPRLDPILFGLVPTARGDAWKERGLWDRAEAAYAEAIHARPLNTSVWYALARLHVERGHLDRAAATLAEAVRMVPEDSQLRVRFTLAHLCAGDRAGWRRSNIALLDRFGGTSNAMTADPIAWACVLGPEGTADPEVPIRLAKAALRGATETATKANYLTTLGAALYRAGRFDDAIRRLEEGIGLRGAVDVPLEWAFLAMADHRRGHRDEAMRRLERLREHQPSADSTEFWNELQIRLLRSEAEAVILYDPMFPADPFAK